MTTRICFIGNSHAGAWKLAWTNAGADVREGFEATFFASAGLGRRELTFRRGQLIADTEQVSKHFKFTSGGRDRIVFADYDVVVLIGLDSFQETMLGVCQTCGTVDHRAWVPVSQLVTRDVLRTVVTQGLAKPLGLLSAVRANTAARIFFAARPFPGEAVLQRDDFQRYRDARDTGYLAALVATYQQIVNELVARNDAEVVWQDESTMRYPGFTKAEFVDGAARLMSGIAFQENSSSHANEAFGAVMLRKLLRRIGGTPALAPERTRPRLVHEREGHAPAVRAGIRPSGG